MGYLLTRKKVVKVAIETIWGTEVTGTSDIYVEDLEINPTSGFLKRPGAGLYIGNANAGVVEGQAGKCSFKTELRGNGVIGMGSGMDAAVAVLLQACWLVKTLEVYQVNSSPANWETLSIDVYEDGKLKTLYGAMGTVTLETTAGNRVMLNFEFDGIWKAPADIALPEFAPSSVAPMQFAGATVSLGGATRKIDKLNIALQNQVVARKDGAGTGGIAHFCVTDNDPQINVDPEAELAAVYDINGEWLAGTAQAFSVAFTDGTNTVTITCPAVQFTEVPEGDRDGLQIYEITGQCNHSSGDDALYITVT